VLVYSVGRRRRRFEDARQEIRCRPRPLVEALVDLRRHFEGEIHSRARQEIHCRPLCLTEASAALLRRVGPLPPIVGAAHREIHSLPHLTEASAALHLHFEEDVEGSNRIHFHPRVFDQVPPFDRTTVAHHRLAVVVLPIIE